jgi:hypothetical protein
MFDFLKRAFGHSPIAPGPDIKSGPSRASVCPTSQNVTAGNEIPKTSKLVGAAAVKRYFELSNVITVAKAGGDFATAVRAARETYPLMPAVVRQMKIEFGGFDICTSHAVHTASTLMAVIGDRQGISELRETLQATPELRGWLPFAEEAQADADLVDRIMAAVNAQPGVKQKELKEKIDGDGRRLGLLASWLEKGKRLQRVSQGSTFLLYSTAFPLSSLASESDPSPEDRCSPEPILVSVHRRGPTRSTARARNVDFARITYIRLPRAPIAWQERSQDQKGATSVSKTGSAPEDPGSKVPRFSVTGDGWTLSSEESLAPAKRPNSAYRETFHTAGSTIWIDRTGKRVEFPTAPAVVLTTDRQGSRLAERGLAYDVYRADVNGDGSGMLFLSRDGILHGYTEALDSFLVDRVEDIPEYAEQAKRFGIDPHSLKNHVRCVALTQDRSRSLVTVVDEAWCYDLTTNRPVWGLRFPSKEGWTKVAAERSERVGASADVVAALQLMGLALPVSPEAITRQYKVLAMRWHPDRNPNDLASTRKFQELGAAMELLTGVDLSRLSGSEIERVVYQQILHQSTVSLRPGINMTISMTMQLGGAFAVDWIYAANFANEENSAFLAGYSGRIVEVSPDGLPLRVYDIGTVPRQVARTSSHLFILTATRLYILREDQLVALVDVLDQGKLIIGNRGFGLLQPKHFQWFTHAGQLLGEVKTRDPIRRTYFGAEGLVVETRTHRGVVSGAQNWW